MAAPPSHPGQHRGLELEKGFGVGLGLWLASFGLKIGGELGLGLGLRHGRLQLLHKLSGFLPSELGLA